MVFGILLTFSVVLLIEEGFAPFVYEPKDLSSSSISVPALEEYLEEINNESLGFAKVFVINLPERTDKLDAITLSAAITDFDFDIVDGVRAADVADKALPPGMDRNTIMGGENTVGAWRAEVNAVRQIVEDKLPNALILEDDADWDITLKNQLQEFSRGSRFITGASPNGSNTLSPYGDDWDVIWLGHCGVSIWPEDTRRYVITNDPTVPPTHELFANDGPAALPDLSEYENPATRIVFKAGWTLGSWAYAVSYSGALKIVNQLGLEYDNAAYDVELGFMCRDGKINCVSVHPPLFGTHKAAGSGEKDSDIVSFHDEARIRPFTYNIAKSVRLNMHHLVNGELDQVSNQFEDMPELQGPMTREFRFEWALVRGRGSCSFDIQKMLGGFTMDGAALPLRRGV